MKENVKVSLITVCYNAGALIEETLRSATQQTYQNFELVIVDGGSNDNTLEIVKKFSDYTGTVISEKDNGIYDAMNKGVRASKGEWVYFLNAGDAFYSDTILEEVFGNNEITNSDFIYARVQTRNEPTGIDYLNGKPVSLVDFYSHYPICHQATFSRKHLFDKVGYFDLKYPLVADSEWFIRLFRDNSIRKVYLDKVVAYYDIQGATYHKRMKGYREYILVGFTHFPPGIALLNLLSYPLIWAKVKIIRTFQHMAWFKKYRELKFRNQRAS